MKYDKLRREKILEQMQIQNGTWSGVGGLSVLCRLTAPVKRPMEPEFYKKVKML